MEFFENVFLHCLEALRVADACECDVRKKGLSRRPWAELLYSRQRLGEGHCEIQHAIFPLLTEDLKALDEQIKWPRC